MSDPIAVPDSKSAVSEMQTLMTEITRALVDNASDIGKVIGKQGRTARSLRTILGAASMKLQRRFSLDIVEAGRTPTDHQNDQDHDQPERD